jgi:hypothetical protein
MATSKMNARTYRLLGGIGAVCAILLLTFSFRHSSPLSRSSKYDGHDGRLANIYNATLGFERVFVINMPSRTDARDMWTLAGHLTNVSVEFRDGIAEIAEKARPPGTEKYTKSHSLGA